MLTIGEFSKICHVTKKTLRHYDEIGLLKPEHVAENGYRYYTVPQLRVMLKISKLKDYGFSLPEIAAVIARDDPDSLAAKIREKRSALKQSIEDKQKLLDLMERDCELLKRRMDIMDYQFEVKLMELEPVVIYSHRKVMSVAEFDEGFGKLFQGVGKLGHQVAGPVYTIYHDDEFNDEASDMELAVTVAKEGEGTRILPGGLHACVTHIGDFNEAYKSIFAGLVEWIENNGYEYVGAPFDKYLRSKDVEPNPDAFVTEVCFPVRKKQG